MANMSYCRFENTYRDLMDCYGHIEDELSETEERYRKRLILLCRHIADCFDDDENMEVL